MGRKKAQAPSEYVSPEEMLHRIDKAIRDRRSSPTEILKLQRRRERVMEQIALQQATQPTDPSSEFTDAQQRFLNKLTGDDYGLIKKERELWEGVYRAENARWAALYARRTAPETPGQAEPLSAPPSQEAYEPSRQFPKSEDPITQFIQHAALLRGQGMDPAKVLRQFDRLKQPQELESETE